MYPDLFTFHFACTNLSYILFMYIIVSFYVTITHCKCTNNAYMNACALHTYLLTYIHTHIHTYTHTHIHRYIHTYIDR